MTESFRKPFRKKKNKENTVGKRRMTIDSQTSPQQCIYIFYSAFMLVTLPALYIVKFQAYTFV